MDILACRCCAATGAPDLPDIYIRCPATGDAVPTELDTETVVFESLPSIELPFKCPSCGGRHQWKPKDAWIEKQNSCH
jgi:hypothetical protein